ncbi:hypothetical protein ACLKA6_002385 [Drosophila palustris]
MTEVQRSCNAFAKDLFDLVTRNSSAERIVPCFNAIISPVSIQTSLIYAYMGADGSTAEELRQGLKLGSGDREEIAKSFHEFWTKQCSYGDRFTLRSVNRLFVNESLTLQSEFRKLAEDYFHSKPQALKFSDSVQATNTINELVMKDTENKIQNLLQPDAVNADTSAVLVNALYFKGKFKKPFTPESTMSDDFYVDQDSRVEVDMMYQEDKFKYVELPEVNARAVQMPYEDSNISLLIILPNETTGLFDLERKLNTAELGDIESRMTMEDVEIAMPRFSLEFDLDLKETLQALGISKLFDDSADLSRLFTTATGQKISAAKHRGYISVNEAGSEAAAVTFMKMVPMMLNMQKKTFKVDHPFLFFIYNPKAVFFAGRFVEPQRKINLPSANRLQSISESMKMSRMSSRNSD